MPHPPAPRGAGGAEGFSDEKRKKRSEVAEKTVSKGTTGEKISPRGFEETTVPATNNPRVALPGFPDGQAEFDEMDFENHMVQKREARDREQREKDREDRKAARLRQRRMLEEGCSPAGAGAAAVRTAAEAAPEIYDPARGRVRTLSTGRRGVNPEYERELAEEKRKLAAEQLAEAAAGAVVLPGSLQAGGVAGPEEAGVHDPVDGGSFILGGGEQEEVLEDVNPVVERQKGVERQKKEQDEARARQREERRREREARRAPAAAAAEDPVEARLHAGGGGKLLVGDSKNPPNLQTSGKTPQQVVQQVVQHQKPPAKVAGAKAKTAAAPPVSKAAAAASKAGLLDQPRPKSKAAARSGAPAGRGAVRAPAAKAKTPAGAKTPVTKTNGKTPAQQSKAAAGAGGSAVNGGAKKKR